MLKMKAAKKEFVATFIWLFNISGIITIIMTFKIAQVKEIN